MGKQRNSLYYDKAFLKPHYNCSYKETFYYPMWQKAIKLLNKKSNIIEIGCGTGQFTEMLFDKGYKRYFGFDFSKVGIKNCKRLGDMFEVADARRDILTDKNYDIAICLEVLEHIKDDIKVIKKVKKGTTFIGSVPQADDPAHVRVFPTMKDVINRYSELISFDYIEEINGRYLFKGII